MEYRIGMEWDGMTTNIKVLKLEKMLFGKMNTPLLAQLFRVKYDNQII